MDEPVAGEVNRDMFDEKPSLSHTPIPPVPPTTQDWRFYLELSSFAGFIFPFGHIFGPLVLWVIKKDSIPEVNEAGKKVLNFNLSWTIWMILSCGLGYVVWAVIALLAALKAANREPFKHPWTIAFLK
jgi:uncharacterized protein